ncbi:MAG: glycoside hydrolase family 88 protein [Fidelibacterota bacterium]|nr:MAG: glycoside hydrolase family 88 protein [Candidatus Neomarinimicrobiota bacterium]
MITQNRMVRRVLFSPARMVTLLLVLHYPEVLSAQNLDSLVSRSLEFAAQQLQATVVAVGDSTEYPRSTLEDGSWSVKSSSSWTSGFFPGCLWYMFQWTGDSLWYRWARRWTAGLRDEQYDTGTHDVGFKVFCSYGNGYRLTRESGYDEVILRAAQSLATRYNSTVGCTRSWNNRTFPVIIDNMMNLELLLWASKNGGEASWYDMAVSHALRTMEDHVRMDGSTYQIVDYNPTTGDIIQKETAQGYSVESTWARGQSWGLYGFTMAYRETGDDRFLETAQGLADYVVHNLPDDYVPYWDYQAPDLPNEEKDASAAAIAASALLELSTLATGEQDQLAYRAAAENILASLCSPAYLAEGTNSHGILLHGVGNHNKDTEVDVSLIYANYYFIEALLRYSGVIQPKLALRGDSQPVPEGFVVYQNYPNPFNPHTTIPYQLSSPSPVTFVVYDLTGRLAHTFEGGIQGPGRHQFKFNAGTLSSGIYLVKIQAGTQSQSVKMTLMR